MSSFYKNKVQISVSPWGAIDGNEIKKFTMKNAKNQEVDLITYGATIVAVRIPDKNGVIDDVVCGFDNIEGYLSDVNPYFGATIGRVANRIGNAKFTLDNKEYQVSKSHGEHMLHGGVKGWDSKIWEASIEGSTVVMSLLSQDGDEGFPGAVVASVQFRLTNDGSLCLSMKAMTTKPTPINMTNHSYFNLAGHGTNSEEIYKHEVVIHANNWTVTDSDSIPTGDNKLVEGTIMDLRQPTVLGNVINDVPCGGYDHNFCISRNIDVVRDELIAKVIHPDSGRYLEVFTNQPGVQFYTANYFPSRDQVGISGKDGKIYFKHGAFCLETQNYPDAVNHKSFPSSIYRPDHLYYHTVTYKFGIVS